MKSFLKHLFKSVGHTYRSGHARNYWGIGQGGINMVIESVTLSDMLEKKRQQTH